MLAALLPVIVAGGGATALGLSLVPSAENGLAKVLPTEIRAVAPKGVIFFSVALLVGTYLGSAYKSNTNGWAYQRALQIHFEHLRTCSLRELQTNYVRQELGQEPLPSEVFCPTALP